jgi:glutathione S-transferase
MPLTLHYHPLSSCSHKVLIALDELGLAFEGQMPNLGDPAARQDFVALWPTGKIPLLQDGLQVVPETSVIIEYLVQQAGEAGQTLLPGDPAQALEVRLMDRLSDLYVMTPMQAIVADRLRPEADRDPLTVQKARETLSMAYAMLDGRLGARPWLAGDAFSMADCAAAPALFFATTLVPLPSELQRLGAYFERLLARPSVARTLAQARPFFQYYPFHDAIPSRFR